MVLKMERTGGHRSLEGKSPPLARIGNLRFCVLIVEIFGSRFQLIRMWYPEGRG